MKHTTHKHHTPQKPFFLIRALALLCVGTLTATLAGCGAAPISSSTVSAVKTPATVSTEPAAPGLYDGWATRINNPEAAYIIGQVGTLAIAATIQMELAEGEDNTFALTLTALDDTTFAEKATATFDDIVPVTLADNFVRLRGNQLLVLCDTRVLALNENLETIQETPLPQAVIDAMQPEENAPGGENAVGFTGYDVSNDMTQYVYGNSAGLFLCDAATGATRQLFENTYGTFEDDMPDITALESPRFSTDDKQVVASSMVFYAENSNIYLFNLDRGTSEMLSLTPFSTFEENSAVIDPNYANFRKDFGGVLGTHATVYLGANHYAAIYHGTGNESTWEIYCGRLDDPDFSHAKKTPVDPFPQQDGTWFFSILADGRILFGGEDGNLYCSLPYDQMP